MKPQCQQPKGSNQNKKKRKCYILFNPPYSVSVKTSIGRTFIKLISKHSLPNHKFVETFNNKTKPSYSCMPKHQIKNKWSHKKMLQHKPTELQELCNCLVKEDCPMNGLCLTSSILYQATIKYSNDKYKQKRCKGICEAAFKKC